MRLLLLTTALLASATAAVAQTSGRTSDPQAYLAAPADPLGYYERSQQAEKLINDQKWAEAEPLLIRLAAEYPLDGHTWGRLGTALRRQGKHAAAIEAYRKTLHLLGPGLPFRARYWIAAGQAALGDHPAAIGTLKAMVFDDAYLGRSDLMTDDNFAALRGLPAFRDLAGQRDVAGLSRDAGWRADIEHMVAELKRNSPTYRDRPFPEEFLRLQRELSAAVPSLSDEEVFIGMGRMIGVLDQGHTNLFPVSRRLRFDPLPIRLHAFADGLYIVRGYAGHEDLAGAEVVAFGGVPAAEAIRRMGAAMGVEGPIQILWNGPQVIVYGPYLKGLGLSASSDQAELTLRLRDGRTVKRLLKTAPREPEKRMWSLTPPPGVAAPAYLSRMGEMHWLQPMPEARAVYAQVNSILNDPDETLAQFGKRLRSVLGETGAASVILDVRHNNGGNTFTYVELLRTLIAFSTGEGHQVYVLAGRDVYSAAGNLTTELERLTGAVFVGEPTSQTGNQYGDESNVELPWSGLQGGFSGLRWQLSHPWDQRRSIVPDVPVQLAAKDYFAGRDPVLDAALELIRRRTKAGAAG